MKILVADDDTNLRTIIRTTLLTAGHHVVEASQGEEALQALSAEPEIGVALLDCDMPGMDGYEVCRRIRAKHKGIYILMVTGRGHDDDVVAGLEAGANDYLTKPFRPETLRLRVLVATRFAA